jgi:hypothetical protein
MNLPCLALRLPPLPSRLGMVLFFEWRPRLGAAAQPICLVGMASGRAAARHVTYGRSCDRTSLSFPLSIAE